MTNGDFLLMLRDDGPRDTFVAAALVIGGVLVIAVVIHLIHRHRNRTKLTPEQARFRAALRAEGYRMAGLNEAEWNAYLTSHELQPKRDRVDRLIDDALAEPGDDDPFDGLVHDHNDCWGDR